MDIFISISRTNYEKIEAHHSYMIKTNVYFSLESILGNYPSAHLAVSTQKIAIIQIFMENGFSEL